MKSPSSAILTNRIQSSHPLARRYNDVRMATEALAAPLSAEDCGAQSMPDASPVKWHLAHTSWFFETFLLKGDRYAPFNPGFEHLFNSYYNAVGAQFDRPRRGLLTRPSLDAVFDYRRHVDAAMTERLENGRFEESALALVELGLHHEQQHQELILTDIKHLFAQSPLAPKYRERWPLNGVTALAPKWIGVGGGVHEIGADAGAFHFDNEGPRHETLIGDFEISNLLVTNGDFIGFIEDGGYDRAEFWLDDGFRLARREGWKAPLYWRGESGERRIFTLHGDAPIDPFAPVCHLSFYEAEAYARWAGARLPTEAEWEVASARAASGGNFVESRAFHPLALRTAPADGQIAQMFGDVWEWTRSDYAPYPGYQPARGAVGEYNGKFMSGKYVLRGGSCATPESHIRPTYRNFFPPETRWQFSGLRLARDAARRGRKHKSRPEFFEIDNRSVGADIAEITHGLLREEAEISPKYFYDRTGSHLFETITRLPEYYVPAAEGEIYEERGAEIGAAARAMLGETFQMVDLGAGNCEKAEKLIPSVRPSRYVAVDISAEFLKASVNRLAAKFPAIEMAGVGIDFSASLDLPSKLRDSPTLVFYPGSSLGNFGRDAALHLLTNVRAINRSIAILIGLDLVKDRSVLEAAYDDAIGVTAAFNLNILRHVNEIVGADFDPAKWRHVSFFNEAASRVEMRLEAIVDQTITWPGGKRRFSAGERILTEHSRKWRKDAITGMLKEAGFGAPQFWTDEADRFAVALAKGS